MDVYNDADGENPPSRIRIALVVVMVFVAIAAIIFLTYTVAQQRCEHIAMPSSCGAVDADADGVEQPPPTPIPDEDPVPQEAPPSPPQSESGGESAESAMASEPNDDEEEVTSTASEHEQPHEMNFETAFVDDDVAAQFPVDSVIPTGDEGAMCFYTGGTPNLLMCPWKK